MKRIVHGKNARLWICLAAVAIIRLRKGASQFERSFPSLGAAVAEESAVKSGNFRQQPREFRLILVEEKIRDMNQPAGLTFDRRLNSGVVVAERIHSDSAQEIQIALAL